MPRPDRETGRVRYACARLVQANELRNSNSGQREYVPAMSFDRIVSSPPTIWYCISPGRIEMSEVGVAERLSTELTQPVRSIVAAPSPATLRVPMGVAPS